MGIKPILFNTEMVRAILEGRKTQTRRRIKPQPTVCTEEELKDRALSGFDPYGFTVGITIPEKLAKECPYQPGDILWVRETFCALPVTPGGHMRGHDVYYYRADGDLRPDGWHRNWHPSIHMPKEAARIFLQVTNIWPSRVKTISDEQALAEGVPDDGDYPLDNPVYCPVCKGEGLIDRVHPETLGHMDVDCPYCDTPRKRFSYLWNSTIKPGEDYPKYSWDGNPWVWAIEFERCEKPEGWCIPCL